MINKGLYFRHGVPMPGWRSSLQRPELATRVGIRNRTVWNTCALTGDEGAALVEFALASIVFFAMLFGVFAFCVASYAYHYTSEAAREGTRYAIVRGSQCHINLPNAPASFHCGASATDISNHVKGLGYPGIDSDNMNVIVTTSSPVYSTPAPSTTTWKPCDSTPPPALPDPPGETNCNYPGDQVAVTVIYSFPLPFQFWNQQTLKVRSTSSMVYSQ